MRRLEIIFAIPTLGHRLTVDVSKSPMCLAILAVNMPARGWACVRACVRACVCAGGRAGGRAGLRACRRPYPLLLGLTAHAPD